MSNYRWQWLENVWLRRLYLILLIPLYLTVPLIWGARERYTESFEEFVEEW